ncbi:MAG TPA: M67 family metallopeptidase [Mariprofundaceae bacterium]|nr:M67 family metallopeptidase [Mariprofundaceae bacterium]
MQEPARFKSPEYLNVLAAEASEQICRIDPDSIRTMGDGAGRGYPLEVCGLLIGRITPQGWEITSAREVPNLNTERAADRFILDPDAYRAIDRELQGSGTEIVGIYHSHPDCPAKPSPTDLDGAWDGFAYIIVSVYKQEMQDIRCWALSPEGDKFQAVQIENHTSHQSRNP